MVVFELISGLIKEKCNFHRFYACPFNPFLRLIFPFHYVGDINCRAGSLYKITFTFNIFYAYMGCFYKYIYDNILQLICIKNWIRLLLVVLTLVPFLREEVCFAPDNKV